MYTYKFIEVKHSAWTGKPKESFEEIIEEYAALGWRLSQVIPMMSTSGIKKTKIIFEKKVNDDFYSGRGRLGLIDDDSFV